MICSDNIAGSNGAAERFRGGMVDGEATNDSGKGVWDVTNRGCYGALLCNSKGYGVR